MLYVKKLNLLLSSQFLFTTSWCVIILPDCLFLDSFNFKITSGLSHVSHISKKLLRFKKIKSQKLALYTMWGTTHMLFGTQLDMI